MEYIQLMLFLSGCFFVANFLKNPDRIISYIKNVRQFWLPFILLFVIFGVATVIVVAFTGV